MSIPSQKEKVSYALLSMIMYEGYLLYIGTYCSGVFYVGKGILWHCDDDVITDISDLIEGVYTIESHKKYTKKIVMSVSNKLLSMVYNITRNLISSISVFYK